MFEEQCKLDVLCAIWKRGIETVEANSKLRDFVTTLPDDVCQSKLRFVLEFGDHGFISSLSKCRRNNGQSVFEWKFICNRFNATPRGILYQCGDCGPEKLTPFKEFMVSMGLWSLHAPSKAMGGFATEPKHITIRFWCSEDVEWIVTFREGAFHYHDSWLRSHAFAYAEIEEGRYACSEAEAAESGEE